ncbi:hypothetical protein CEXT_593221 [Caerostris extrusa]|uniref:Uncharacterized protein n=1 Tax=Caerostris extrusa TaxID=172846 RepID=A0AAV4P709_CAEEX|nr:hypothetical protein CEXT_593221 [Caerostris extrusa]
MMLSDTESYFTDDTDTVRPSSIACWPIISKKNTNYRESIQTKDRLALTLSGDLMVSLSYQFRIGRSTAPPNTGSHHNYNGGFSINLLASVDADYKFVLVDIGSEGRP